MRNSSHCGSHHHINMYGFILFSYSNPPPFAMHPQFHSTTTTICHLLQSKYLRALTCCCPPSLMLASRLKQQQTPINPMSYIICHVFQKGHSNSESVGPVSTWVCFQVEFEFVDLYTPYFELIGSHITSLIFWPNQQLTRSSLQFTKKRSTRSMNTILFIVKVK